MVRRPGQVENTGRGRERSGGETRGNHSSARLSLSEQPPVHFWTTPPWRTIPQARKINRSHKGGRGPADATHSAVKNGRPLYVATWSCMRKRPCQQPPRSCRTAGTVGREAGEAALCHLRVNAMRVPARNEQHAHQSTINHGLL